MILARAVGRQWVYVYWSCGVKFAIHSGLGVLSAELVWGCPYPRARSQNLNQLFAFSWQFANPPKTYGEHNTESRGTRYRRLGAVLVLEILRRVKLRKGVVWRTIPRVSYPT